MNEKVKLILQELKKKIETKQVIAICLCLCLMLFQCGFKAYKKVQQQRFANAVHIFQDSDRPMIGNKNAEVEMVIFFDFTCGHCAATFNALKEILFENDYIKNNFLKLYFVSLPANLASLRMHQITQCIQEKYEYHSIIDGFLSQQRNFILDSNNNVLPMTSILQNIDSYVINRKLISKTDLEKCVTDDKRKMETTQEALEFIKKYDIKATPWIIVNGKKENIASPHQIMEFLNKLNNEYETLFPKKAK